MINGHFKNSPTGAPLQEHTGNLWDLHQAGAWIAIAANGVVKPNGEAVMGAGQAKEAATRFPRLPKSLGTKIQIGGNHPNIFPTLRIITWPTKEHFSNPSEIPLILEGIPVIRGLLDLYQIPSLYCPRLGCGLGHLNWDDVRAALTPLVDDRFIFMSFR